MDQQPPKVRFWIFVGVSVSSQTRDLLLLKGLKLDRFEYKTVFMVGRIAHAGITVEEVNSVVANVKETLTPHLSFPFTLRLVPFAEEACGVWVKPYQPEFQTTH